MEEERTPLSPEEIWEVAQRKGYDKNVETQGKTPWKSIGAQIYVNIRDKEDSPFIKTQTRPVRFYLRSSRPTELRPSIIPSKKMPYLERDLHPFLAYYAYYYLKAHLKTIQHSKSKKEFSEWLHPDMVGCYFPIDDWEAEVVDFGSAIGNISIKLFSFEIKRELNFTNLRESFFQAVSNSSWANEGYLVAAEIYSDEDFRNELKRLSTSFGIGVIKIDIHDPDSSEILFPSEFEKSLDWDTINKLTINPDFREFLKRVTTDVSSKEIRREKYDKILSMEELIKLLQK